MNLLGCIETLVELIPKYVSRSRMLYYPLTESAELKWGGMLDHNHLLILISTQEKYIPSPCRVLSSQPAYAGNSGSEGIGRLQAHTASTGLLL